MTSLIQLGFGVVYLRAAVARVYGERRIARALKVTAMAVTAVATVIGYRFVVFLITLYTTTT